MAEPRFVKPASWQQGRLTQTLIAGGRLVVFDHPHDKPVSGEIYDPSTNRWQDVTSTNAPRFGSFAEGNGPIGSPRYFAFEDWIIVTWFDGNRSEDYQGAVFDAYSNTWRSMSTAGMADMQATAIELGTAGSYVRLGRGIDPHSPKGSVQDAAYDVRANRWRPIVRPATLSPPAISTTAVATDGQVVVFGSPATGPLGGAIYDVHHDRWTPLPTAGAPPGRFAPYVAVASRQIVVWSGSATFDTRHHLVDGAVYSLDGGRWSSIATQNAPDPSTGLFEVDAAWTGEALVFRERHTASNGDPRRLAFFDPMLGQWWRSVATSHARPWKLAHGRILVPDPTRPMLYHPRSKLECPVVLPTIPLFTNLQLDTQLVVHALVGDELIVWGRTDQKTQERGCRRGAPCRPSVPELVTSSHGAVITP